MKRMGVYKHWNNTDVAMLVLDWVKNEHGATYKVTVNWWNIVSHWRDTGIKETLYIPIERFEKDWRLVG
jgi:hypothetical protein